MLHGRADLPRRAGHASGHYTADVSRWTLALLLGREWEPDSVADFDRMRPGRVFEGRYLRMPSGTPMEAWLAEMCDHAVSYEMQRYHEQRPISFTNWPTLDPLRHETESTKEEEQALRGQSGRSAIREYDNDAVSVSVSSFRATAAFPASFYASYHAYPYYPDFMNLDPGYRKARSSRGASSYFGYLADLKRHYGSTPLLIAEFGVPSSRGVAHQQPQGWHHGGHTEAAQGDIDARLLREMWEARCAGGVVFAWLDEWFKKNWVVADVELPEERNPLWHNALDAEQNYGLRAMRAGAARKVSLRGDAAEWSGATRLASGSGGLRALWAQADEAWIYLRLDLAPGAPPRRHAVLIDTYDRTLGNHALPAGLPGRTRDGTEFAVILAGSGASEVQVSESYRPFLAGPGRRNPAMASRAVREGAFLPLVVETNRERITRSGRVHPALQSPWGRLREGSLDPAADDYDTLADWHRSDGMIEIRLPWGLLNVADPSSHRVVHNPPGSESGTTTTEGMRFSVVAWSADQVLEAMPAAGPDGLLEGSATFLWPGWEEPTWHTELKESYFRLGREFQALGGRPFGS